MGGKRLEVIDFNVPLDPQGAFLGLAIARKSGRAERKAKRRKNVSKINVQCPNSFLIPHLYVFRIER